MGERGTFINLNESCDHKVMSDEKYQIHSTPRDFYGQVWKSDLSFDLSSGVDHIYDTKVNYYVIYDVIPESLIWNLPLFSLSVVLINIVEYRTNH